VIYPREQPALRLRFDDHLLFLREAIVFNVFHVSLSAADISNLSVLYTGVPHICAQQLR
jgi:hypothetical protein